jgi:hypothetical protein
MMAGVPMTVLPAWTWAGKLACSAATQPVVWRTEFLQALRKKADKNPLTLNRFRVSFVVSVQLS